MPSPRRTRLPISGSGSGLPTPRGGARHRTGASGASLKDSWGPRRRVGSRRAARTAGEIKRAMNWCGGGYYAFFGPEQYGVSCASAAPRHWAGPEGRIGSLTGGLGCLGPKSCHRPIALSQRSIRIPPLHPDAGRSIVPPVQEGLMHRSEGPERSLDGPARSNLVCARHRPGTWAGPPRCLGGPDRGLEGALRSTRDV